MLSNFFNSIKGAYREGVARGYEDPGLWVERVKREGDALVLYSEAQMPIRSLLFQRALHLVGGISALRDGEKLEVRQYIRLPVEEPPHA